MKKTLVVNRKRKNDAPSFEGVSDNIMEVKIMTTTLKTENDLPKLVDVQYLKKYFNCGNDAVYALMRRKDFPSIKVAGKYFCLIEKLPDWIERQSKKLSR